MYSHCMCNTNTSSIVCVCVCVRVCACVCVRACVCVCVFVITQSHKCACCGHATPLTTADLGQISTWMQAHHASCRIEP